MPTVPDDAAFTAYIGIIRRYRDKFVAHLDSDHEMYVPPLDTAKEFEYYVDSPLAQFFEDFYQHPANMPLRRMLKRPPGVIVQVCAPSPMISYAMSSPLMSATGMTFPSG